MKNTGRTKYKKTITHYVFLVLAHGFDCLLCNTVLRGGKQHSEKKIALSQRVGKSLIILSVLL